ncbi:hypothetical protein HHK36_009301 [Tetracentron sinense]|uniref:RING-type domain-containing protein n=1 Tax=Tetracentron sinense TaxID=13715 RepID=A0A835DI98_TETSI|nr:hypothetical protein HHK36_009301 [Tetracentron sinense]
MSMFRRSDLDPYQSKDGMINRGVFPSLSGEKEEKPSIIQDELASESINNLATQLANTEVERKALKTFPTLTYTVGLKLPGLDTKCVICLSEFCPGERIRILPKCNHGFHIQCIDKWQMSHSSYPTFRNCLIESCKKIVGSDVEPTLSGRVVPLEPEVERMDWMGGQEQFLPHAYDDTPLDHFVGGWIITIAVVVAMISVVPIGIGRLRHAMILGSHIATGIVSQNMFPSNPPQLLQDFLGNVHSRKLLLHTPLHQSPDTPVAPKGNGHDSYMGERSSQAHVVMIISVLFCALICALGMNSVIRCAFRCSRRAASSESSNNSATRLANTGIKKKALKTFPTLTYSAGLELPGLDTECVICLSEFCPGKRIRILPKCNHGFHVRCIDKWLMSHSSCPTCRNCLIESCKKIVGSEAAPPLPGRVVPLEPEGLIRTYRGNC